MRELQIIRGAKTGKVLDVKIISYKNAHIGEHGYIYGDSPVTKDVDKKEFAYYDELSKSLTMFYDGHYRQRSNRYYVLLDEEDKKNWEGVNYDGKNWKADQKV